MKRMIIDGKQGRFLVEGVDYGDYLEGFFLYEPPIAGELKGMNGPVDYLLRPFRIVLGPNSMLEDVMLTCLNVVTHKQVYNHAVSEMLRIRLVQKTYRDFVFYVPECSSPVESEASNAK